jgi:site-specific DNA-methyltransferase (adenine-specific)
MTRVSHCFALGEVFNADCVQAMQAIHGSADLVLADPPFGIDFDKSAAMYNRDAANVIPGYKEVKDYADFTDKWIASAHYALRPGGTLWVVSGWTNSHVVHATLLQKGFKIINKVIWRYNFGVYTKKKFTTCHYEMFYAVKPPVKYRTFFRLLEDTKADYHDRQSVWDIPRQYMPGKQKNATKLPDALVKKVILHTTYKADVVADPFMGNGTAVFQAIAAGRRAYGYEINPAAYEAVVARLERLKA